jgi:hypothetical protein
MLVGVVFVTDGCTRVSCGAGLLVLLTWSTLCDVHLCEAIGRGHSKPFFGAPFVEAEPLEYGVLEDGMCQHPTLGCNMHPPNPNNDVRVKRLARLGRKKVET